MPAERRRVSSERLGVRTWGFRRGMRAQGALRRLRMLASRRRPVRMLAAYVPPLHHLRPPHRPRRSHPGRARHRARVGRVPRERAEHPLRVASRPAQGHPPPRHRSRARSPRHRARSPRRACQAARGDRAGGAKDSRDRGLNPNPSGSTSPRRHRCRRRCRAPPSGPAAALVRRARTRGSRRTAWAARGTRNRRGERERAVGALRGFREVAI